MKSITVEGTLREDLGSTSANRLRNEGKVPCVIYGAEENIHFYADTVDFKDALYTAEAHLIIAKVDGKDHKCVIREAQWHPVTDELLHLDLYQFVEGKPVTIDVPIKLVGNAKGVRNGGRLKVNLRKLPVKASEENMPSQLEINIEDLRIGEAIRIQDIDSEGFEIMREPTRTILTIQTARNAILDDEEEETEEGEEGTEEGAEATAEGGEEAAS